MSRETGKRWHTGRGEYNVALYAPGDRCEAMHGSPVIAFWSVVAWFPGKPTFHVSFQDDEGGEAAARQFFREPTI
jgi:hypothetical protein